MPFSERLWYWPACPFSLSLICDRDMQNPDVLISTKTLTYLFQTDRKWLKFKSNMIAKKIDSTVFPVSV